MQRDYESSFRELEKIIKELESKDISLEDSIKKYEEGIELYKYLNNTLKTYEGKGAGRFFIEISHTLNSFFLNASTTGQHQNNSCLLLIN